MVHKSPRFSNEKTYKIDTLGGIVSSEHPSFVGLDRLSDAENLWNKNSILSTRPGIAATEDGWITDYRHNPDTCKVFYADFPFEAIPGYNRLFAVVRDEEFYINAVEFFVADENGKAHYLTFKEFVGPNGGVSYEIKNILFVKDKPIDGCGIFVLIPIFRTDGYTGNQTREVYCYELSSDYKHVIQIGLHNFYCPIILKHGFGRSAPMEIKEGKTTSYPEGVNILGGSFEACFDCDGISSQFTLPVTLASDAFVRVHLYTSSTAYISFTINGSKNFSDPVSFMGKNITVAIERSSGNLYFYADDQPYSVPMLHSNNGLRVFSNVDTYDQAYDLLSRRSKPISFDNRLFFPGGGNRGDKIYFSGKNQPLYYSERNCISVGNSDYDVTALSLQSRYVIAFKEREIYRLSLSETNYIDRDTLLQDESLTFIPTPSYKITKINDSIGCDLPTTIVNCANRLVWFHSDGAVYTLYGSNLYTEGSVYELSSEISDRLHSFNYEQLNYIFAADLNGYYVLGLPDRLFIMDARASGFRYLSGHKAAKKDYGGLPWFIWKAPEGAKFMSAFTCGGKEYFLMGTSYYDYLYLACLSGEKDIIFNDDKEIEEKLPSYSLSTAIFGDSLSLGQRVTINALSKNDGEIQLFDQNGVFKTAEIKGSGRLRNFIIPTPYKKGGIGIKIKGSGQFLLKDITYHLSERIY